MKIRDFKLDSLKGFLIILVILGHLIGNNNSDVVNECSRTFIYTFHMPLFILISGYLTKIKDNRRDFLYSLLNIFIPLCIFQALNILIFFIIGGNVDISMLITPYWTLWYLLSLIFWKVILQFTPKALLNKPTLYLLIAFTLSIFCGLMPHGRIMSIQRTINFFPFFLFGYYIKQGKFIQLNKIWNKNISIASIILVFILIVCGLCPQNNSTLLRGADHYSIIEIPAKIYILLSSFITSISFYKLARENKILTIIGKDSLLYYLYHGIIVSFFVQPLVHHFNLPQSFPFMLLYCILIASAIYLLSRIKVCRWLINPFAYKLSS